MKSRFDVVRRTLTVESKVFLTPRMLRVVFHSAELEGFHSPSPDDHCKVFFPADEDSEGAKRDFTPRKWDTASGTFTLEFALHAHGPAAAWAQSAEAGDTLSIGGPRGSTVVPDDFDWYLMVGDACALPSFARRLEELRADAPTHVFALVADEAEQQQFATRPQGSVHWIHAQAEGQDDTSAFLSALKNFQLPAGEGFIWVAGEDAVARELYRYFTAECNHPAQWIKAAAYWTRTA